MSPFVLASGVWFLLSWGSGLHYGQVTLAALAFGALLVARRDSLPAWSGMGATERTLWCLVLWAALGTAFSLRPQTTLEAAAALGSGLAVAMLVRRQEWPFAADWAELLFAGSALYAFAYAFSGLVLAEWWTGAGSSNPLQVASWFSANQNLLAGGLGVPAILLGLARIASRRGRVVWAAFGVVAGLFALVFAGSRGAYLALAVGLCWLALRWRDGRRRLGMALSVTVVALGLLTVGAPFSRLMSRYAPEWMPPAGGANGAVGGANDFRREDFWKGALTLAGARPWVGQGLGTFAAAAYRLDMPTALTPREPIARYRLLLEHAHNDWLELAADIGWPATLILGVCALAWMRRRWLVRVKGGDILGLESVLVAAGATSLVDMNLRAPGLAWGLMLCFAAVESRPEGGEARRPADAFFQGVALGAALLAFVFLLGCWVAQSARKSEDPGSNWARAAVLLQPLDADVAARAEEHGAVPWPWSSWAGRYESAWWWHEAVRAGQRGDAKEQEDDARRAVALRPYFAPGWYWLGLQLGAWGRTAEADAMMDRALALEPNFSRALAWKADLAFAGHQVREAQALVAKVVAIQGLIQADHREDSYSRYIQTADPAWLAAHKRVQPF